MTMTNLNRFGITNVAPNNVKYKRVLDTQVEDLSTILSNFEQRIAEVRSSNKFSPIGVREETARIGREALAELAKAVDSPRKYLKQNLDAYNVPDRLPSVHEWAKENGYDLATAHAVLRDLREHVAGLDPALVGQVLTDAAEKGDAAPLVAIQSAHPWLRPKHAASVMDAAARVWCESRAPAEAQEIREAQMAFDTTARVAEAFVRRGAAVPVVVPPIQQ